ncbi:tetratricopeptide repeat protein [Desulfopila sp. IMCC35006]|uniref:tetratricopeptide repeat protein n=1 Tax=Desulfopila sp. IMCC35006 TaxID=2569542 RepID=UPI0010AC8B71|nr:tetratricopeptide repeat protein [Desulfopila sp. IMCC35006]TKB28164.1 tetratricopeptide repeat protein [Desulfopila sp. IMCC35006]
MTHRSHLLLVFSCCLFFVSCAIKQPASPQPAPESTTSQSEEKEPADLACAYFYFLWGTHAEFDEQYSEALEAYEKALICDQDAEYVKEKVPVLLLKMGEFDKATDWLAQAIIDNPDNITYRLLLASLYIQQEKVEEAIVQYNKVLEKDPTNEGVHLRLALLYTHSGDYQKAEEIFQKLLKHDVDSYFTHLSYARLLKQMGKFSEAAVEYEKALDLNWSKDLAYEIGYLYVSHEMFSDALRIYTTITDDDAYDERAGLSRIQALVDLNREDEALRELHNIRLYTKDKANIDLIIAKLLLRKKEVVQAKKILTSLAKETNSSEARYMLALLAYQEEDYAASLAQLARIDPESDNLEEAVYLQTRIHQKLGNIDEAIRLLKKHTETEIGRSPLFFALLSSLYQAKGDNQAAMTLMEKAVDLYPENQQLLFEYGLILEKTGMSDQAIEVMEKVLELQPDHAEALNYIGYTWADKNIHLEKALEYILRADALKPNNGFIIDSLGWAYYRLGNFKQAVRELERSLKLIPDDPHIYEHLGDVYRSLHRFPEALKVYKKAYQLFKDEKDKADIKQKINALENR